MIVERQRTPIPGKPLVELLDVSRRFGKKRNRNRSFQDLFIRLFQSRTAPSADESADEFWPLRGISLSIAPGDCIGIVGSNGAGKSTLLKLITGILEPTAGELYVRGRISSLLELGAGFQPDLSGRENIYLNGSIYGLQRSQMSERLDKIIEYAELGEFIDTPVKHYSSGMYMRLGFAVAIFTDPTLLLVDEVLAVGDAAFQRKCMQSIMDFRRRGGTLLLVSHDLETIQNICNRAIWLSDGRIKAEGHPTDVVMAYLRDLARKHNKVEAAGQPTDGDGGDPEDIETGSIETESEGMSPEKLARRWGSGAIEITQVTFLDRNGDPTTTFYAGDPLSIRLDYHTTEKVEKPVFGLAVHHQSGTHIAGPNTKFGGHQIPYVDGRGAITYRIPVLPFLEGEYYLSVAVVDEADSETYDYHDRLYSFHVHRGQSTERYGMIALGGEWQIAPPVPHGTSEGEDSEHSTFPHPPEETTEPRNNAEADAPRALASTLD